MSESAHLAIGDYVRFLDSNAGVIPARNFQNFYVGQTRTYGEAEYVFAPFVIDGDASTRSGETPQARLVAVQSPLTISLFTEAVERRYLLRSSKVGMTLDPSASPPRFDETNILGQYLWSVTGYALEADGEAVALVLNGPRNAVDRQVPRGRLTSGAVGALPATGNIAVR